MLASSAERLAASSGMTTFLALADKPLKLPRGQAGARAGYGHRFIAESFVRCFRYDCAIDAAGKCDGARAMSGDVCEQYGAFGGEFRHGGVPSTGRQAGMVEWQSKG